MATYTERAIAMLQALRNEVPTAQHLEEVASICAYLRKEDMIEWGLTYETMTTDQKARLIVNTFRHHMFGTLKNARKGQIWEENAADIASAGTQLDEQVPSP